MKWPLHKQSTVSPIGLDVGARQVKAIQLCASRLVAGGFSPPHAFRGIVPEFHWKPGRRWRSRPR